jgi:hypothetical protein
MSERKTTLERAFELAESGRFHDVREVRRALQQEGYWDSVPQTAPRSVSRQLAELIRKKSAQLN